MTRWIVTGSQPFTEIENEEFQDMLIYLKPALQGHLVQSDAIRDRVLSNAGVLRQGTRKYLSTLPGVLAIACDGWTSSNRVAFLAITGSWITRDWRLEETLLDFVELQGAHDGQNMANAVASVVTELGIGEKLIALVSDNASSNGTLVRHLSTTLRRTTPNTRWDGEKGHIRCLAHIIHLSVMSLLDGISAIPPQTDIHGFNPDDDFMTTESAERLVADSNAESLESDETNYLDPLVDLSSAISKVGINLFGTLSKLICV